MIGRVLAAERAAASHQLRRPGDLAVRLAGDEFAVILPATDETGAVPIAERIVEAVRAIALLHPTSSTGLATISAGVASIIAPALGDAVPSLPVGRADTALYLAKNRGGDQLRSAEQAAAANAEPATWALPLVLAFALSAALAGLAGAVLSLQAGSATPLGFDAVLLDAVTACLVGGVSLRGGRGSVLGIMIGVFTLRFLVSGIAGLGAPFWAQSLASGALLIALILVEGGYSGFARRRALARHRAAVTG